MGARQLKYCLKEFSVCHDLNLNEMSFSIAYNVPGITEGGLKLFKISEWYAAFGNTMLTDVEAAAQGLAVV